MRKLLLLLIAVPGISNLAFTQYWQQKVDYRIDVTLNDKTHSLDGFEKIDYTNNSPDTLHYIWFHCWPNAYRNDKTAFSDHLLENGKTGFYFSGREEKGYINRLDFKVNNSTAQVEDHPEHIDIIKLILPHALAPGQQISITTPFHVKLPYNFSRGGHDGQSYQVTQWYPKPAVYDKNGWHPMPYLDQGEFYSEFGDFDVRITLPENYVVAATGLLQNEAEKDWLVARSTFDWKPEIIKTKIKGGGIKTSTKLYPTSSTQTKTLQYKQTAIHDFAWFADKRFIVRQDSCQLPTGKTITVFSYYTPMHKDEWDKSLQFAKDGVRHYSSLVGEYPFDIVSVVQGPQSFGGGMEYPTITVISPSGSEMELDNTIAHEIGHNWFYGILGSNEREHAWMDEGINSYYDNKYHISKYGIKSQWERILFETKAISKTDQPITLASDKFSETNYYLTAYYKTGEWMRYLESVLGAEVFNKAMQEYYRRWQFRHPQPEDFKNVLEQSSGRNLDTAFSYLSKQGILPNQERKGTRAGFALNETFLRSYLKDPSRDLILVGPAIGYNSYDQFMAGAFITNMKLPPSAFQFFLAPMYGFGSKRATGIGFLNYSFYPAGIFRKIEAGLTGSRFTMNEFKPDEGEKLYMAFQKIAPGIKFIFREKKPRSHVHRYIRFKSFFIGEDALRFSRDSIFNPPDTTIVEQFSTVRENRTLNQLQFVFENNRTLYPFRGEWKVEQGKDFIRAAFTGNYFFNYPTEGGLHVRFFAGKFIFTSPKTILKQFATDRYHLNMTGPNGYEDYTYSDYFLGRNKFEGFTSQQIMIRDGGFKIRTDLLSQKVGRSDDWLMAANFTTTVPKGLNPLTMLPVKIPLRLYLDIGTEAGAWKTGSESDRFIYDAGLQFSFFKETINIFVPVIHSRVFKDYIQSSIDKKGRLWKTISFSIDISNFSFRKLNSNLDF